MNQNPTGRFSGLAETYARCRPSYPSDAIDFIVAVAGLGKDSLIADVGCGTGISSRLFAERGLQVTGVEPNDDMRGQAEEALRKKDGASATSVSRLSYINGTAEHTTLADASCDLVLSAQAFHWFDPSKALAEFHRILKVGGWVALMWNERDESDEFTSKYGDVFRTARETAGVEGPRQKAGYALLDSPLFDLKQRDVFISHQDVDEEGLVGRAFSASYAPRENPERAAFEQALRSLFRRYARAASPGAPAQVRINYGTSVFTAKKGAN